MNNGKVEIEGSFLLCAALLYYLDRDGLFPWLLLFCTLHELGHWAAIRLAGGVVTRLRLSCFGAELCLSAAAPLTGSGMLAAALAGPGINLVLAALLAALAGRGMGERFYLLSGMNLALGFFNLLPLRWLDGGRALEAGLLLFLDERTTERVLKLCGLAVTTGLLRLGWLILRGSGGRSFAPALAGLWALLMQLRERRQTFRDKDGKS